MNTKAKEAHDSVFKSDHQEVEILTLDEFITLAKQLNWAKIWESSEGKVGEVVTPCTSIQEVLDLVERNKYMNLTLDNVEDMYHFKTEESKYSWTTSNKCSSDTSNGKLATTTPPQI